MLTCKLRTCLFWTEQKMVARHCLCLLGSKRRLGNHPCRCHMCDSPKGTTGKPVAISSNVSITVSHSNVWGIHSSWFHQNRTEGTRIEHDTQILWSLKRTGVALFLVVKPRQDRCRMRCDVWNAPHAFVLQGLQCYFYTIAKRFGELVRYRMGSRCYRLSLSKGRNLGSKPS